MTRHQTQDTGWQRLTFRRILSLFLVGFLSATCLAQDVAVDLADNNFEGFPNTAWTVFNNALPDEQTGMLGELPGYPGDFLDLESLKTFGNFWPANEINYSGAFQDLPVDGSTLSVGDLLQLDGYVLNPSGDESLTGSANDAFIEITYVANGTGGLTEGQEFGFGGARSDNVAVQLEDEWVQLFTSGSFIPAEAASVRVKAVFVQAATHDPGAAYFDNLSLTILEFTPPGCDADADGDCELDDLNQLYDAIGDTGGAFDLDGSGTVDGDDITKWLELASDSSNGANPNGNTLKPGDVNLNGSVDSADLGLLLNNFGSTSGAYYGAGNLNGDASVDSADLGMLLNNFGFTSAASTSAVPEPGTLSLMMTAMLGLFGATRRRRSR